MAAWSGGSNPATREGCAGTTVRVDAWMQCRMSCWRSGLAASMKVWKDEEWSVTGLFGACHLLHPRPSLATPASKECLATQSQLDSVCSGFFKENSSFMVYRKAGSTFLLRPDFRGSGFSPGPTPKRSFGATADNGCGVQGTNDQRMRHLHRIPEPVSALIAHHTTTKL